jgi:protein O-mannosyl-transferase
VNRPAIHYNGRLAACSVAALLGGLVYLNALHNPFVYDDYHTVVENASIADLTNLRAIVLGAVTRPIVNFSYAVDRAAWGTAPLGFHATNVLLHMLNVVLLFQLAWQYGKSSVAAFAAAGLLAVHPMMTEAVGYVSGRSEVLCATFFMLALMAGRRWTRGEGAGWAVLTTGLWVAALATKESAAMFPFVFLVYDWFSAAGTEAERRRRIWTVHAPLIGVALLAGIVRLVIFARVEYPGQSSVHWSYVLLELDVIRRYVWMLLVPANQALFHEVAPVGLFEPRTFLAVCVVGSIVASSWALRRVDWVASVGLLWFLLVLVPSSALIALDQGEPMAEHRVYLASCGIFLAAGAAIGWMGARLSRTTAIGVSARRGWLGAAVFALVLVSLGTSTLVRNAVWRNPVTLWRESVDLAPTHYRPRLLLGEALQDAGQRDAAIEEYQTAIRLRPGDPTAYVKVGQCFAEVGQFARAREHFLKAIDVAPRDLSARRSLTVLEEMEARIQIQ